MKVLVAEDDAVARRLLSGYLEKWGHEVVAGEDGAAAWELFQAGEFPVVLSDWVMPRMDGLELVRRIRAGKHPGYVYVILITSRRQKADVAEGIETGADDFLSKPVDRDELHVRLWEAERVIGLHQTLADQTRVLRDALTRSSARAVAFCTLLLPPLKQRTTAGRRPRRALPVHASTDAHPRGTRAVSRKSTGADARLDRFTPRLMNLGLIDRRQARPCPQLARTGEGSGLARSSRRIVEI